MLTSIDTVLIVTYLIATLIIGYVSSKRQTGADFIIANRSLRLFPFVGTVVASFIGGSILVVYSAYIYEFGIGALAGFLGLAIGVLVFARYTKKLRALSHEHNFHTIADYFHHRYDRKTGSLISAVVSGTVILFIVNQFIAGTAILSSLSGWSYEIALFTSFGVVLVYLILGGFRSVVSTDIFQYLLLLVLMVVIGGTAAGRSHLTFSGALENSMSATLALSFFIYGFLSVWSANELWQRIYAARDDRTVQRGLAISTVCMVVIGIALALIALSVRVSFPGINPNETIIYGITNLMPPLLLGLGVVLMFAAIMSTADTLIFILAGNIAKDVIAKIRKTNTDVTMARDIRLAILGTIVTATVFAYFFRDIVDLALVNAGLAMTITPSIIANFRWHLKAPAIVASVVTGIIYLILIGFFSAITPQLAVSTVLVSGVTLLITQKISKKVDRNSGI